MDKIQIIEKLFLYSLLSSFLLLPLALLLNLKSKTWLSVFIAVYGIVFFLLNTYYDSIPKEFRKFYFPAYTYIEYLVFAVLLMANIPKKSTKKLIIVLSVLFALFQLIYFLTTKLKKLDAVPIGIETILIFIYIFLFLYSYFTENTSSYIYTNYCFWISVGLLIYLGGSFFLNILANHISNISDYWYLTYLAETIKNILFAVAIFIKARKPQQNKKQPAAVPYLDMI